MASNQQHFRRATGRVAAVLPANMNGGDQQQNYPPAPRLQQQQQQQQTAYHNYQPTGYGQPPPPVAQQQPTMYYEQDPYAQQLAANIGAYQYQQQQPVQQPRNNSHYNSISPQPPRPAHAQQRQPPRQQHMASVLNRHDSAGDSGETLDMHGQLRGKLQTRSSDEAGDSTLTQSSLADDMQRMNLNGKASHGAIRPTALQRKTAPPDHGRKREQDLENEYDNDDGTTGIEVDSSLFPEDIQQMSRIKRSEKYGAGLPKPAAVITTNVPPPVASQLAPQQPIHQGIEIAHQQRPGQINTQLSRGNMGSGPGSAHTPSSGHVSSAHTGPNSALDDGFDSHESHYYGRGSLPQPYQGSPYQQQQQQNRPPPPPHDYPHQQHHQQQSNMRSPMQSQYQQYGSVAPPERSPYSYPQQLPQHHQQQQHSSSR
ncbi:hypothetical protein DL89DRAFT_1407 [Linderina pennispora]|uniref:Uncharacterized protein n=1 Tax=Linderina pennispora TaxID=61395 RepID=A0A1Y1WJB0_9FUNG|nr:uncharacterized protein DL89DRAFT_1407 [Linderina pennispora]ORX73627.1 hypothetical protein DL89DRAFT_1407 [Linderina pennispora]